MFEKVQRGLAQAARWLAEECRHAPRRAFVVALVVAMHIGALIVLAQQRFVVSVGQPKQKLTVRTMTLPKPAKPPAKVQPKPKRVVKKKPPKPKKTAAKKKPKPRKTRKKVVRKPKPKPQVDPKEFEAVSRLLDQAQESIEKIDRTRHKNRESIAVEKPKRIKRLNVDSVVVSRSVKDKSAYSNELRRRLQLMLQLPEQGEVRVKLTVNRKGKVVKVVLLSAQNSKNGAYIQHTLPTLAFPGFGSHFQGEKGHEFLLTLKSDL